MEPLVVPEDLRDLSDEELTSLGHEIKDRVESLAEEAADSDDSLEEVEHLISAFDRVNSELADRETRRSEREERIGAALERFAPMDEDEVDEAEEAAEVEDAAAASTDVEPEAEFTEEAPAEEAAEEIVEAVVEAPAEAAVEAAPEVLTPEVVTEAPARPIPVASTLRSRQPKAVAEKPAAAPAKAAPGLHARFNENGKRDGDAINPAALAEVIVDKRRQHSNVPTGTFEKLTLASSTQDFEFSVGSGYEENFAVLEAVRQRQIDARDAATALVASGGVCAPLEPDYNFFRKAEALNPVEQCLPLVGAPRGGIRFISPTDFRDAEPGVRVTTEAEDAAGYTNQTPPGPTDPKPCVAVTCPPIEECRVDVVSQCVRFGNLNFRVFPEQVESFLEDLAVIFTETKEIFYLDAIDANSTAVTAAPTYGAIRSFIDHLARAAANYRRRHHMAPDSTLDLMLPSWVSELMYVDMVNDHSLGLASICEDPMAAVACAFAQLNLSVCWYYDSATGADQEFNDAQAAGPLNPFPTTVRSYLFCPGTFVRLNAGTLDLGIVRDSFLNSTNDLEMFSEEWIQVCFVGLESLRIDHTLCPDGTAPEPVPPFAC